MIDHDIGHGVIIRWDDDGRGLWWKHPGHRAWSTLRFKPDPASTGHVLVAGDPQHTDVLTIQGSLLCPVGCGAHGVITNGRWIPC
jgi:hypothetical protein